MFEALAARTLALRMVCSAGSGIGLSRKLPWIVRRPWIVLRVALVGTAPSEPPGGAGASSALLRPAANRSRPLPASALCFRKARREDLERGGELSWLADFIGWGGFVDWN